MQNLKLGYSPCPNDTFIFYAVSSGLIRLNNFEISTFLHDVETLNQMAFKEKFDITKLSFHAWLYVKDRYKLLKNGAALGYGCGPVVIAKSPGIDIEKSRIAIPGRWTTAHLLFKLWDSKVKEKIFCQYDEIFNLIESGKADCGLIIHESRFTFKKAGFYEIVDLGAWWERKTSLPIPLGCIAVKKNIEEKTAVEIDELIAKSIHYSKSNLKQAMPYIKKHAGETEPDILKKHIKMFVNEFSLGIGDKGFAAIKQLEKTAQEARIK